MTDTPRVYSRTSTRHFVRHYAEMPIAHVVMLPSMLVEMLVRRGEYSHADAHDAQRAAA